LAKKVAILLISALALSGCCESQRNLFIENLPQGVVADHDAAQIKGDPLVKEIPERSAYNPVTRQYFILPGYKPRPEVKR
jgi:hypothetical protein